jgi:hypothetical protein
MLDHRRSPASANPISYHPPIHPPRGPPNWIDADKRFFLDEDLDQDRYEIDKSSGQKICTAEGCPYGWRTGTCAMNSING